MQQSRMVWAGLCSCLLLAAVAQGQRPPGTGTVGGANAGGAAGPEAPATPAGTTEPLSTIPEVDTENTFGLNNTVGAPLANGTLPVATNKVCVLSLKIDEARSNFSIGGTVTQPLSANIALANSSQAPAATGTVAIALYNATSCPKNISQLIPELESGSWGFVKGGNDISLTPRTSTIIVTTAQGAQVGSANITGLRFFLFSPEPFTGVIPGVSGAPTNLTLLAGTGSLSSPVAGDVSARLVGVSSATYPDIAVEGVERNSDRQQGQAQTTASDEGSITLTIANVSFEWPITPGTVPGNNFIRATAVVSGTIVASADIPGGLREASPSDVAYPELTRELSISRTGENATQAGSPPANRGAGETTTVSTSPGGGTSANVAPGQNVAPVSNPSLQSGSSAGTMHVQAVQLLMSALLAAGVLRLFA